MPDPTNADHPVRLAISGFGRLAQNYYVPALRRLRRDATVVAVADPSPASREAVKRLVSGASAFETQSQMLDAVRVDGVLVASPPAEHLPAWNGAAAREGLCVFMEKPLVAPGQLVLLDRSAEAARRLMVNFNRRFWTRYRQVAEVVRSGRIGRLVSAELELQVDVTRWMSVTSHRVEPGHGGALYDLGSQMIDLAAVIAGESPTAVRVNATSSRWQADHLDVRLTFPGGGDVRCTLAYDAPTRERIHVRCTDGEVRIDNPNFAVHVARDGQASGVVRSKAADLFTFAGHAARRHTSMSRMTIELALRTFLDGIRSPQPCFSPGFDDAVFNAAALEAAQRSLDGGGVGEAIPTVLSETST
jgi:predicted dehydrogenase